jgi:hypothetical protein
MFAWKTCKLFPMQTKGKHIIIIASVCIQKRKPVFAGQGLRVYEQHVDQLLVRQFSFRECSPVVVLAPMSNHQVQSYFIIYSMQYTSSCQRYRCFIGNYYHLSRENKSCEGRKVNPLFLNTFKFQVTRSLCRLGLFEGIRNVKPS